MGSERWSVGAGLTRLFQAVGRASLALDIQDSHSGNMAVRLVDEDGRDELVITATGSQKGDLEPGQICPLSFGTASSGYFKSSSETDVHVRILSLPGVSASMHAHVKELTIASMDDGKKPGPSPDFIPVDPLGFHYLGSRVPVDWFAVPSGSPEMAETIPERLRAHPLTVIFGHGAMARGRSLKEAFFLLAVGNASGAVVRSMWRLGIDVERLRAEVLADPAAMFPHVPPPYEVEGDDRDETGAEDELAREFRKAGRRIFESGLSPFHTGSLSLRGVEEMIYAPKASMPEETGGPLVSLPLAPQIGDGPELALHKTIYAGSGFQTVLHCYVPEAEACARFVYPGASGPADRIIPIDAEGGFLYLSVPVLSPRFDMETFLRSLHDYKMVVVRGGGVWAAGSNSVSEVLHHPSSLREICLYRIGAFERGLDLGKMEPDKARNW